MFSKKNFLDLFPVPEYLLFSSCGIAITDTSVRFVEFKHQPFSSHRKMARYEQVALPSGTVQSGYINDTEKLSDALRGLVARHGVRYAYVTLPEERTYLFSAVIGKVPEEGLRDAVAFIIEENVPVTLSESVFDFNVVEDMKSTNQYRVTVSVLSKKVVDFYVQVFESVGITPVSFDIESQSISRAIIKRGDTSTQLIINLAEKKTGFYIVENEVVQFTTTLPFGNSGGSARAHLNDLKAEMQKVFTFWNARPANAGNLDKKIGKVLVCGPGSFNDELVRDLMEEAPVYYDLANPWINVSDRWLDLPKEHITQDAMDYVSAIGLVLPRAVKHYV